MKPSEYNFYFKVDQKTILAYNSLSTALVELSSEEFEALNAGFQPSPDSALNPSQLQAFKEELTKEGFLIPQDLDELVKIRSIHAGMRNRSRQMGLTIIPTLNCNFRCKYCFSYTRKQHMEESVQQEVLKFADNLLTKTDSLTVSWFGGEPTLCIDTIENLMHGFSILCEKHHVPFGDSSIITNGFLLDAERANRLCRLGITRAQITLDGDRETHNQRRPLRGGKETFDRILDNITQTHDVLDIFIRINLDRANADSAVRALDALSARNLQGKVGVYFGHVKPFTEACGDIGTTCFNNQEFSSLSLEFTREAIARGFTSFPYPQLQLDGVCGADKPFSYVIAPNGFLFKCWAEASVGEDWSVGSIMKEDGSAQQERNLAAYMDWDPLSKEQCVDCSILPLCMGGCPHQTIRHNLAEDCSQWRYNLLETLAIRYKLGDRVQITTGRKKV